MLNWHFVERYKQFRLQLFSMVTPKDIRYCKSRQCIPHATFHLDGMTILTAIYSKSCVLPSLNTTAHW